MYAVTWSSWTVNVAGGQPHSPRCCAIVTHVLRRGRGESTLALGGWRRPGLVWACRTTSRDARLGLLDTGPGSTGAQELASACWWLLGETRSIGLRPAPKWARLPPGGSGCQPGRRRWAVGPGLKVLLLLLPFFHGFGSPLLTVAWEFDPKCVDDHGRVTIHDSVSGKHTPNIKRMQECIRDAWGTILNKHAAS